MEGKNCKGQQSYTARDCIYDGNNDVLNIVRSLQNRQFKLENELKKIKCFIDNLIINCKDYIKPQSKLNQLNEVVEVTEQVEAKLIVTNDMQLNNLKVSESIFKKIPLDTIFISCLMVVAFFIVDFSNITPMTNDEILEYNNTSVTKLTVSNPLAQQVYNFIYTDTTLDIENGTEFGKAFESSYIETEWLVEEVNEIAQLTIIGLGSLYTSDAMIELVFTYPIATALEEIILEHVIIDDIVQTPTQQAAYFKTLFSNYLKEKQYY